MSEGRREGGREGGRKIWRDGRIEAENEGRRVSERVRK